MGKVEMGFFSFTEVTDPAEHYSYNEWHQLDHLPEQIPLEGVVHGQRWVSTPACRRARRVSEPPLDAIHYMTLYLMSGPGEPVLRRFRAWGERLSQLGRFHRQRRSHLSGPFPLLKAYAARRVRVSPEAIPYRPQRGIYVTVEAPRRGVASDAWARWQDEVHVPDLLGVPGVAGVWVFAERSSDAHAGPAGRRITVLYLDDEPLAVTERLERAREGWREEGRLPDWSGEVATLFAGPFETIVPWQWHWFERDR